MRAQRTITRSEDELTHSRPVHVWTWAFENLDKTVSWAESEPNPCCGDVRYVHGMANIEPHDHDHYELELILSGSATHRTDEGETQLRCGHVQVLAPGEVHTMDKVDGLYVVHCAYIGEWLAGDIRELLAFDGLVPLFLPTIMLRKAHRVRVPQWSLTEDQMALVIRELRDIAGECRRGEPADLYLKWSLKKLMLLLWRAFRETDSTALLPLRTDIRDAVSAIEDHVTQGEPLSAGLLAQKLGMSGATFTRTFRAATGYGPMEYYQRRRVERASWLLRDPSLSVTTIAHELGYADASHFGRVFRRYTGRSPAQYAAQLRRTPG